MKKFTNILIIALVIFGISSTANALQYGYGLSEIDLHSFDYAAAQNDTMIFARDLGWYSSGYALALDQGQIQSDAFPKTYLDETLDLWATVLTANGFAEAHSNSGMTSSTAEAIAGYDSLNDINYGTFSGAQAGTFVSAYEFFVQGGGDVTFTINYSLENAIYGDEPGFSMAGAGALLAVYQENGIDGQGNWLDLASIYGLDEEAGTLTVVLEGLQAGSTFSVFAGTAAWAMAYAPGGENTPVPEPATMLLLGTGLIGIAGVNRKKFIKK